MAAVSDTEDPTVSVLMTCWNRPEWLGQAIGSVVAQGFTDWELLIADDHSDIQEVHHTLLSWSMGDPQLRIKLFWHGTTPKEREATVRYATLTNELFLSSRGRFITYLCDDDYYAPDRFERMVPLLEAGADVVYGAQELIGDVVGIRHTRGVLSDAWQLVDHNSVMHTREAFQAAGGWPDDPKFWRTADAEFWRRLTSAGYEFVPVEGAPTDAKRYHAGCIDTKARAGKDPWSPS